MCQTCSLNIVINQLCTRPKKGVQRHFDHNTHICYNANAVVCFHWSSSSFSCHHNIIIKYSALLRKNPQSTGKKPLTVFRLPDFLVRLNFSFVWQSSAFWCLLIQHFFVRRYNHDDPIIKYIYTYICYVLN